MPSDARRSSTVMTECIARNQNWRARYYLPPARGRFGHYHDPANGALARPPVFEWPHAGAWLDAPATQLLARFGANHIHAMPGDHTSFPYARYLLLPLR